MDPADFFSKGFRVTKTFNKCNVLGMIFLSFIVNLASQYNFVFPPLVLCRGKKKHFVEVELITILETIHEGLIIIN